MVREALGFERRVEEQHGVGVYADGRGERERAARVLRAHGAGKQHGAHRGDGDGDTVPDCTIVGLPFRATQMLLRPDHARHSM